MLFFVQSKIPEQVIYKSALQNVSAKKKKKDSQITPHEEKGQSRLETRNWKPWPLLKQRNRN